MDWASRAIRVALSPGLRPLRSWSLSVHAEARLINRKGLDHDYAYYVGQAACGYMA